jgi:hypothetical protein
MHVDRAIARPPGPFSTRASAARNVWGPASSGRLRNPSTWASRSFAISLTCDFDNLVMPSVSTSLDDVLVALYRGYDFEALVRAAIHSW